MLFCVFLSALPSVSNTTTTAATITHTTTTEGLRERTEHLDIFLFTPITQWCSISDVLFTGGWGVSNFSV